VDAQITTINQRLQDGIWNSTDTKLQRGSILDQIL
jgi:hypothetical protein